MRSSRRVRSLVEAFKSWGLQAGDRVALLSENRWEWAVSDFATLAMGAVDFLAKPKDAAAGRLDDIADRLIAKIKVAKHAAGRKLPPAVIDDAAGTTLASASTPFWSQSASALRRRSVGTSRYGSDTRTPRS